MLSKKDQLFINKYIRRYFPKDEFSVFVFGSFARNEESNRSDIDIAIKGSLPIPPSSWQMLENDFVESSFERKIVLIDYHRVDDKFKQIIDSSGIEI
jgi:uncharacterized protein